MFYGEFEHSLDRKGRLIIPSKFRDVLKEAYVEKLYVTRGLDKCLFLFSEEEWRTQESAFKSKSFTKSINRKFNRLFFSGAQEATPDKQGRILLPSYLKEHAGIKKDIMLIGVSNRIEIWSKEKWQEYYEGSRESFEAIAEDLIEEQ
ncbi:MAG: division/cell wall cluster transcriptional repressor MraZ [Candidatus Omnitrophica bacterium]|nr:division/cell wall cluster transcriptional repressor MraZ [Candidatus Omnitrophota bacterium]